MSSRTNHLPRGHISGSIQAFATARYANWVRHNKDKYYLLNKRCFQCKKRTAFFYCIKHEIARKVRDKSRLKFKERYHIG